MTKGLAAPRLCSSRCRAALLLPEGIGNAHTSRADKFAFPLALLEQNLRLFRYANLIGLLSECQLPSVVKDRRSVHPLPIGTSPLPAERGIGLEPTPRIKPTGNKKPGVERRACPSSPSAAPAERHSDGCARSSAAYYPVFVANLTSCESGKPGPTASPVPTGYCRHQESITEFKLPSSGRYQEFCGFF